MNITLKDKTFYFDKCSLAPEDQILFNNIGCVTVTELKRDTNYLIAPQLPGIGGKYLRAEAFGTTIMSVSGMHALLS